MRRACTWRLRRLSARVFDWPSARSPSDGDADEHDDDREEREHELGPHRGRDTPDRARQRVLEPGRETSETATSLGLEGRR